MTEVPGEDPAKDKRKRARPSKGHTEGVPLGGLKRSPPPRARSAKQTEDPGVGRKVPSPKPASSKRSVSERKKASGRGPGRPVGSILFTDEQHQMIVTLVQRGVLPNQA